MKNRLDNWALGLVIGGFILMLASWNLSYEYSINFSVFSILIYLSYGIIVLGALLSIAAIIEEDSSKWKPLVAILLSIASYFVNILIAFLGLS